MPSHRDQSNSGNSGGDSKFCDQTPVTLTVTMTAGEWRALCDHPCLLRGPEPGAYFRNAVHGAVRAIAAARKEERDAGAGSRMVLDIFFVEREDGTWFAQCEDHAAWRFSADTFDEAKAKAPTSLKRHHSRQLQFRFFIVGSVGT